MGCAGASGTARHSHQHAGRRSARHRQGGTQAGAPPPAGLSADETTRVRAAAPSSTSTSATRIDDGVRARRRCTALADSPVGLAAFMLDHDARSYELIARVFDGQPEGLTRDDVLDNITLFWLTNTAISSARLYWENKLAFFAAKNVDDPGRRERLSRRALSGAAELGRAGVSQAHPLQQARQGRALRGLGAAATLLRRGSRGLQTPALAGVLGPRYALAVPRLPGPA